MKHDNAVREKNHPVCLSIAGFDPSGGAGTVIDTRAFSAFGCYSAAVITAITFQNTMGVFGSAPQTAEVVLNQLAPVLEDFDLAAIKIGMLPTARIIEAVAGIIADRKLKNIVVDPVIRSTSGFDLIDEKALVALREKLFPLADLITPNLPETARLTEMEVRRESQIREAGERLLALGAKNVLIKGGHLYDDQNRSGRAEYPESRFAKDFLFTGSEVLVFEAPFHEGGATHGSGCALSASIAANLALGKGMIPSIRIAKSFVNEAIRTAENPGRGNSPLNLGFRQWESPKIS